MRIPRLATLVAFLLAVAVGSTIAHDGDGSGRYQLKMKDKIEIGHKVKVFVKAPAHDLVGLLVSMNQGQMPTNWGTLDLQAPLAAWAVFRMPHNGKLKIQCHIDDEPALVGLHLYLQFIAVNPDHHADHGISNLQDFTIVDKKHDDDGDDEDSDDDGDDDDDSDDDHGGEDD